VATIFVIGWMAGVPARGQAEAEGPTLADEAERLLVRLDKRLQEIREWTELQGGYHGDDRRAIDLELTDKRLLALSDLHLLAANVVAQEAQGLDAAAVRGRIEPMMRELPQQIRAHAEDASARASELRSRRDEAAPEELLELEQRIVEEDGRVNQIAQLYVDHLGAMESMGLDASDDRQWLLDAASKRAEFLARRIEASRVRQSRLAEQLESMPDSAALRAEADATARRVEGNVRSLRATVELLDELGVDTAPYRQQIVQATGDISELLDTDVAAGLIRQWFDSGKQWLGANGPKLLLKGIVFLLILLVFRVLARLARRVTVRSLSASKVEVSRLLEDMITSMVHRVIMVLGFLVALSQLGVSLGPLLAGLGVAGFIVGFALQDVLSNFASGMMILFYRPFDVDDLVDVAGAFGKVSRMTLVSTTILTLDHQTLVVPNSKIWGDVIKNVTAQKIRRVDMTFGISYQDDIPAAERVLQAIVAEHPKVLEDPAPKIKLHNLGESSVDFIVWPWVTTEDYWDVYWDITREVKLRFDTQGISIPFPQRDVHLYAQTAEALPGAS
jgi:small conductance mechanosensitive channel